MDAMRGRGTIKSEEMRRKEKKRKEKKRKEKKDVYWLCSVKLNWQIKLKKFHFYTICLFYGNNNHKCRITSAKTFHFNFNFHDWSIPDSILKDKNHLKKSNKWWRGNYCDPQAVWSRSGCWCKWLFWINVTQWSISKLTIQSSYIA